MLSTQIWECPCGALWDAVGAGIRSFHLELTSPQPLSSLEKSQCYFLQIGFTMSGPGSQYKYWNPRFKGTKFQMKSGVIEEERSLSPPAPRIPIGGCGIFAGTSSSPFPVLFCWHVFPSLYPRFFPSSSIFLPRLSTSVKSLVVISVLVLIARCLVVSLCHCCRLQNGSIPLRTQTLVHSLLLMKPYR
jgi:hypothetical protein